ncbi:MAG TPA: bifunctional UDP-N-acetylglucosamine diphosphorylase/glucosamine-1-phosphate N-acetyltransferase GlmU [Steroidobacteraceae bacterium]|nr:bifunctional UDP-N-acetylglucosamine diphosphorylase/glucosamine-1-phosphate N-acetyltransferase GlmU [Steroidobacteraceae bacterium]
MNLNRTKKAPLSVIILAAGQGKRMKSDLPKVLQPLAGQPLLQHVINTARSLEAAALHVVYGHGGELVRAHFGAAGAGSKDGAAKGAAPKRAADDLKWALQDRQLGTGHAVLQGMPGIPDDHLVLILYGDVPLIKADTLRALLALAGPKSLGLLTVKLEDPTGYGRIIRNAHGQVRRIVEQKDASKRELALREGNTGVMAVPAQLLRKWLGKLGNRNSQGEYYLTDVIAMAVKDRIKVSPLVAATEAEVLGVNDKLQLAQLEAEYRRQRARELMLAGVTIIDPARLDIRGEVNVGRDVVLDVNVVLQGPVTLGDRVRIGPNNVISDASIGADTNIKPNCVIERARIGARCEIGPYSRVRPDSTLHDEVHLGNFVEVKNSELARGAKANHLTYLGDSSVGERTNIGAGTITCNYDGANKWRTEIGNDVFVGSGSMLVAPIQIGDGATIGAGSTVTRSAPAGKLTLARSRQLTLENWQRPRKG